MFLVEVDGLVLNSAHMLPTAILLGIIVYVFFGDEIPAQSQRFKQVLRQGPSPCDC